MPSDLRQRLASAFSGFAGRYAPALIALLLLAGCGFFYFNVLVSRNESVLKERSFRGLERMASNFSRKMESYSGKNVRNFLDEDSLYHSDPRHRAFLRDEYGLETDTNGLPGPFLLTYDAGWKIVFRDGRRSASTPLEQFLTPLLRQDLFHHYLLSYGDSILLDGETKSHARLSEYLPPGKAEDTVKGNFIQTGEIRQVSFGGKAYKLFLLPFLVKGKYRFTLGGYMAYEDYLREKNYIPTYAILWMVIGIILVVLMFPLLKVFLMTRTEQLQSRNAISSLASIHILGGILLLIALNTYVYFSLTTTAIKDNLRALADVTEKNFRDERSAAYRELEAAKAYVAKAGRLGDSVLRLSPGDTAGPGYHAGRFYPYLRHIVWTDSSGQQRARWTTKAFVPGKIDVRERDYYRAVTGGELWQADTTAYYFTVISSWVADEKLALLATPFLFPESGSRPRMMVVNISSPFRSMFGTVLPPGYGFCVINEKGDVLFHQDEKRALNENLAEECGEPVQMRSLLQARAPGFFGASYAGSTQKFYIRPLAGTPYSLVTFRDMKPVWSEDLDVITACSILSLMNLSVILLAILIIQASGYRRSMLHSGSILFTWLRPHSRLKRAYATVTACYVYSILLQLAFFLISRDGDPLFLLGISFSYSYILITYAYFQFAVVQERDAMKRQINRRPLWILGGIYLLGLIAFLLISLRSGQLSFLLSQLLLWLFFMRRMPVPFFGRRKTIWLGAAENDYASLLPDRQVRALPFRKAYVLSLGAFIAATAIVPLLIFYFLSYKQERLMSLRHSQALFAARLAETNADSLLQRTDAIGQGYAWPYYASLVPGRISLGKAKDSTETRGPSRFEALYQRIKPSFSEYAREIEDIHNPEGNRAEVSWADSAGYLCCSLRPFRRNAWPGGGLAIRLTSAPGYGMSQAMAGIGRDKLAFLVMLAVVVVLLKGFYFLLERVVRRVFFDGYDDSAHLRESDLQFIDPVREKEHLFVVGPVNSGKVRRVIRQYKNVLPLATIDIADLMKMDLPQKLDDWKKASSASRKDYVLIRHFDMLAGDAALTEKKLELLTGLFELDLRIIILSSRSFEPGSASTQITEQMSNIMNRFYTLYHRWERDEGRELEGSQPIIGAASVKRLPDGDERRPLNEAFLQPASFRFRAARPHTEALYGGFLDSLVQPITDPLLKRKAADQLLAFFIRLDDEYAHSDFLWSLRRPVFQYIRDHRIDCFGFLETPGAHLSERSIYRQLNELFEKICLKIQSLAGNYYLSIWRSLNREEQLTLYDIGMDEMVNPHNRDVATRLESMGLVRTVEHVACYEIMNHSFRDFIFNRLGKKEMNRSALAEEGQDSFSQYQLPILIVVAGLSLFLFTTQQDAFSHLITYLGAAAGGIGALMKILGMIPNAKT